MSRGEFEKLVAEAFGALPEKFKERVKNVAFIVEDEPSKEVRKQQGLSGDETLFGLYTGVPLTQRGGDYGVGAVMPDTIHIYQWPIEDECDGDPQRIRKEVFDTVWHEVAHYFGYEEYDIMKRELDGTNKPRGSSSR